MRKLHGRVEEHISTKHCTAYCKSIRQKLQKTTYQVGLHYTLIHDGEGFLRSKTLVCIFKMHTIHVVFGNFI